MRTLYEFNNLYANEKLVPARLSPCLAPKITERIWLKFGIGLHQTLSDHINVVSYLSSITFNSDVTQTDLSNFPFKYPIAQKCVASISIHVSK
jgi:hypothetical protein